MSEELPKEQAWLLSKADGYADLKMWDAARHELDAVDEAYRTSLPYRSLDLRLTMGTQQWGKAVKLATSLRDQQPREPGHWVHLAYSTRRASGIEPAREILLEARQRFPEEPIIPYNLACYECQLGHKTEALRRLGEAATLEPGWRALAREDEDLKAIWDELDREE
jgi:predicted Zn-dependent protease